MSYEKLTPERFYKQLSEGQYQAIAGARRAVGKASDWSTRAKNAAKAAIDKHFGVAEDGTVPASAKAPKAAKTKAPKAEKVKREAKAAAPKAAKEPKVKAAKTTKTAKTKVDMSDQRAIGAASVLTTLTQVELKNGSLSDKQQKIYDCALSEYVHNSPHGQALLLNELARDGIKAKVQDAVKEVLAAGDITNPDDVLNGAATA